MATTLTPLQVNAVKTNTSAPAMGYMNRYDATTGSLSVTLPALSGLNVGARMLVQKYTQDTSGNFVAFTRAGSDQFDDGATTFTMTSPGESRTLQVVSVSGVKRWKITEAMGETGGATTAATPDLMLIQIDGLTTRSVGYGNYTAGFYVGRTFTSPKIVYQFDTADASGNTTVELRRNGVQIPGSSITVSAANQVDSTATEAARTVTIGQTFVPGDRVAMYVSAIGTTPGKGARAWVMGQSAALVMVADYATPQLAANAASGKRLVFPVGQTYTVASLALPANCYVEGNNSTLKFGNSTTTSTSLSDEIVLVNGSGVTIDNLNFDANSANQSIWSQFRHCVRMQGVFSNVTVKNCDFTNLIGDGVYVNTQTGANIKVGPGNTFTANYDARNGVSIISGDTIEVFSNTFTTTTRSGMPGAIDIEPNASTDHLAHVDVHHNTIVGGTTVGTGQLSAILYVGLRNPPATDIKIRSNDISGTRYTKALYTTGIDGGPFNSVTGLVFDSNNVHGIEPTNGQGFAMDFYIGADVTNNIFNGMYYGIFNYHACLGSTTGNTYPGVTATITQDTPHCS